ncbi:MAG TPA: hypothetical protein O0Y10_03225 [Methanocorpusculum sp.]|nr:hypothetical protein [Methanocorpusculum sp.]HJJ39974.1 hypothetical protein [Methanocorpusculum sp.]
MFFNTEPTLCYAIFSRAVNALGTCFLLHGMHPPDLHRKESEDIESLDAIDIVLIEVCVKLFEASNYLGT